MAEERPVPDKLLDYLLYAPLGAAVVAAEELPRLAERGRERFEKRIGLASSIGKFAVAGVVHRFKVPPSGQMGDTAVETQTAPEASPPGGEDTGTASLRTSQPRRPQLTRSTRPRRTRSTAINQSTQAVQPASAAKGDELPIPAYGTLAASQVVERLASLTASELEAVRKHESATRRRRTVLHRIAQLNMERGGVTA